MPGFDVLDWYLQVVYSVVIGIIVLNFILAIIVDSYMKVRFLCAIHGRVGFFWVDPMNAQAFLR